MITQIELLALIAQTNGVSDEKITKVLAEK